MGTGPGGIRSSIGFDRGGIFWLIDMRALYYLLPGATQFQRAAGDIDLSTGFAQDADRKVLTRPYIQDDGLNAYPIFRNGSFLQIVDRNNGIWDVRFSGGVIRRRATTPLVDAVYNRDRGNSEIYSVHVQSLNARLVDREGNVWFADGNRLYRFYYSSLIKQKLPNDIGPFAISGDGDAGVWIASWTRPDLYRVAHGKTEVLHAPIPETGWSLAYAAPDRTLWFGGKRFLWHLVNRKLVRVEVPPEVLDEVGFLQAITPDRNGGLWFSFGRHGLYRFVDGAWTPFGGRKELPRTGVVSEFTDRLGRVWFGYTKSQLAVLDGDRVRIYGPNDGIRVGNITAIYGRGRGIWIGGEFGLQQFDNGRFHDITAVDGDRLRGISGIVETANGDLWLNGISGIFHIARDEVLKALQDSHYRVKCEHLGSRNGRPGVPMQIRPLPSAIESV
ncbi:MAG TPA: hypothetical protein VE222_00810, partial [Nitrospiraceae bacterium]|nr:hypothetical protein [Nitrospiraceae bacterium]